MDVLVFILLVCVLLLLALAFVLVSSKELKLVRPFSFRSVKLISKRLLTLIRRNVTSTELLSAMRMVILLLWRAFRVFILILAVSLIILLTFSMLL